MFAVREEEAALDIVQDAMLKLAEKYGDRPDDEFPMLFQRILQNTIRDFYRRSKVRSMWTTLLSAFSSDDDEDHDPLETLAADEDDTDVAPVAVDLPAVRFGGAVVRQRGQTGLRLFAERLFFLRSIDPGDPDFVRNLFGV